VGTVPHLDDRVLLCKRNIEPRKGKWTLPAGFMELGETTLQGAARETDEEAGARFEMESLFSVLSVPRVGQVHLFYRARLLSDRFDPGFETIEARLFAESEIPWDEILRRPARRPLPGAHHRYRLTAAAAAAAGAWRTPRGNPDSRGRERDEKQGCPL